MEIWSILDPTHPSFLGLREEETGRQEGGLFITALYFRRVLLEVVNLTDETPLPVNFCQGVNILNIVLFLAGPKIYYSSSQGENSHLFIHFLEAQYNKYGRAP